MTPPSHFVYHIRETSMTCFLVRIYWCVLDSADCNRQFIKIHFKNKDPVESKFMATNLYNGEPMIFIMDPKVS